MKCIIPEYFVNRSIVYLIKTNDLKGTGEFLKRIVIPMNIEAIESVHELDKKATQIELIKQCQLLFANYIKDRLSNLAFYHDRILTMQKIELASKVIESCQTYSDTADNFNAFQNTITKIFNEAKELQHFGGSSAYVGYNRTETRSTYPGGSFGKAIIQAFQIFNPNAYSEMIKHDEWVDRAVEEYDKSVAENSNFYPGVD